MIKELWNELSNLAIDLNSDQFHVMLDFAGHVNAFSLVVYKKGYNENEKPARFDECVARMTEDNLEKAINWLCREYESDNEA